MDTYLEVSGLVRTFGDVVAVNEASLQIARGHLLALLGPSGCGKTTLLRLVGGLDAPDAGRVTLDGTVLNGPGVYVPAERRRVAMVFQDYALFPHMDTGKNVAFGLPRGADRQERIAELLAMVGLPGLSNRMPHELSGGQQQRVALARALAASPRLLLLDEPFSNLDPSIRGRVRGEVRELLWSVGITGLFVTHDQDEALSLADEVAVMIGGRILQIGTPREVYTAPATRAVAEFVGQPNFIPGVADGHSVRCALGTLPLVSPMSGKVDVMVRGEDIIPAGEGGEPATVEQVSYFGHEEVVVLRLAGGTLVRARWRSSTRVGAGNEIRVAVCGPVLAYQAE